MGSNTYLPKGTPCSGCGAPLSNPVNQKLPVYCEECPDPEDTEPEHTENAYRDGKVYVCSTKCSTCIFRPGNPMHLEEGRKEDVVAQNLAMDSALVCHKTTFGSDPRGSAICRGFFDVHGSDTVPLRLAQAMGMIEFQEMAE